MLNFWKKRPERRDWKERSNTAKTLVESQHLNDVFDILREDCARVAMNDTSPDKREEARLDFHAVKRLEDKLHAIANYGKIKENKKKQIR